MLIQTLAYWFVTKNTDLSRAIIENDVRNTILTKTAYSKITNFQFQEGLSISDINLRGRGSSKIKI